MTDERTNSFLLQLLVSADFRARLIRHGLLWGTTLYLIYRGFHFIASTIPEPSPDTIFQYTVLSTTVFGGLTVTAYGALTTLTRRYILIHFRPSLFGLGVLIIHILTSEVVLWHFRLFIGLFTLDRLPRLYTRYAEPLNHLQFWQAPVDPTIVWLFSFSLFYNYLLYAVGLKAFKDLFTLKLRQNELEKENLRLEFDFLKARISPHFLFNTLNNIYSFSIISPTKVGDTILKLADLMRYSLYETNEERVPLSNELTFLTSYIELQRIRHEEHVQILFEVAGQPGVHVIPPLLLIIFVENAFKHGLQSSARASWVRIRVDISATTLGLEVDNSVPTGTRHQPGGIGLSNVRKRLTHFYPAQHQLSIREEANRFTVNLTIQWHESIAPHHHRG